MADNYKLPGSSYEEFVKILKAYSTGKVGIPMSLDNVAQTAGMDKTIVSRNNGFLVQLSLISEGNKKSPNEYYISKNRNIIFPNLFLISRIRKIHFSFQLPIF